MNLRIRPLAAVLSALLLFSGCGASDPYKRPAKNDSGSDSEQKDEEYFYSVWQGEEITPETASENHCVMMGSSGSIIWQDFLIDLTSASKAEVTVCSEDSVMFISESSTGSTALVRIKEKDGDSVVSSSRVISPVEICCVYNEEEHELDYYLSDILVNKVPAEYADGYSEVPVEYSDYRVSSTAAATFPYQKYFSSYSEFENYYDTYHKVLGLDGLKKYLQGFEEKGWFNTHVVFLYGDRSGGDTDYIFLRAVDTGNELDIYLKRDFSGNSGGVSKWQLTCTVPGEYLSDIAPDAVRWIIYDDEEASGY